MYEAGNHEAGSAGNSAAARMQVDFKAKVEQEARERVERDRAALKQAQAEQEVKRQAVIDSRTASARQAARRARKHTKRAWSQAQQEPKACHDELPIPKVTC